MKSTNLNRYQLYSAVCQSSHRLRAPTNASPLLHHSKAGLPTLHSGRRTPAIQCNADSQKLPGTKIAVSDTTFHRATVVENRQASADGSIRLLLLSVEDPNQLADGRRVKHVQENTRWIDSFRVPGQFVAIRHCKGGGSLENCKESVVARKLFGLASSPYVARSSSAMLDASIIEIVASRNGDADEAAVADLGPGALIDVSEVVGQGYMSLFNSAVGLQSALEEGRPLLLLSAGHQGMACLRSALSWTPVQAHATKHSVTLIYVAKSAASAAFLVDWDTWRDSGVKVQVVYVDDDNLDMDNGGGSDAGKGSTLEEVLDYELFCKHNGLAGVLNSGNGGNTFNPSSAIDDAVVVMSGLPGDVASRITKRLTHVGIASERLLFCDFF